MFKLADRCRDLSASVGLGNIVIASTVPTFRSLASVFAPGDITYLAIVNRDVVGEWEIVECTLDVDDITWIRGAVQSSSNGGGHVNFSAGNKDVTVAYSATKAVVHDPNNDVAIIRDINVGRNVNAVGGTITTLTVTTLNVTNAIVAGNLTASIDNTSDIGASGVNRFRDLFLSRNAAIGGTLGVTGLSTLATLSVTGTSSFTGAASFTSTITSANAILASYASAEIGVRNASGAGDEKHWVFSTSQSTTTVVIGTRTDAGAYGNTAIRITRSSATISSIALGAGLIAITDNSYDIGASGASRFRDLFLSRNAVIGGTLTVTGAVTFTSITATSFTGDGSALTGLNATQLTTGTIPSARVSSLGAVLFTGSITATDNSYDIGASGASRFRDLFLSRNAVIGGSLSVTGAVTFTSITATTVAAVAITATAFTGDGSALTALNATQLTTGTVPSARVAGTYAGITSLGPILFTGSITATDNTYDIGASGATRFRDLFLSRNAAIGGNSTIAGSMALGAVTTSAQFALNKTFTTLGTGLHAFEDWTILNTAAASGASGYASYDSRPTLTNTVAEDHLVGFQSRPIFNGSGALSYMAGLNVFGNHTGTGVLTNYYGVKISDVQGAGPVTNSYSLYVEGAVRGGTLNYAIFVTNAIVSFRNSDVYTGSGGTKVASGGRITYLLASNEAVNFAAVQVSFVGNASAASRIFNFQTIESGIVNDGILGLQPNGGTVRLAAGGGATQIGGSLIAITDNAVDIGASGATRFRDLFLSRNAVIGGTLTVASTFVVTNASAGNTITSTVNSAWTLTVTNNGSTAANGLYVNVGASSTGVLFRVDKNGVEKLSVSNTGDSVHGGNAIALTDNVSDIGASGATRFRDLFLARNATIGGTLTSGIHTIIGDQSGGGAPLLIVRGTNLIGGGGRTVYLTYEVVTTDSSTFTAVARIGAHKENGTAANTAGALVFQTNPNGGPLATALTINSTQTVIINSAGTAPGAAQVGVQIAPSSSGTISSSGASTAAYNHWLWMNGNGIVGSLSTSGTTTSYTTSSDQRLKRDLGIAVTHVLRSIKIHDFAWRTDGQKARGVFAQEAFEIAPWAIRVGGDGVDEESGHLTDPWGVEYQRFVPDLIVGWQDHERRITDMHALIDDHERRIGQLEQWRTSAAPTSA